MEDTTRKQRQIAFDESKMQAKNGEDAKQLYLRWRGVITWHKRLGHMNFRKPDKVCKNHNISLSSFKEVPSCVKHASAVRYTGSQINLTLRKSKNMWKPIRSELCGKMPCISIDGVNYFVVFKDDASSYPKVYFELEKLI